MTTSIPDTETLVCQDIKNRQQLGIAKYGRTLATNPLELRAWLQHSYEELLDAALYHKRAIQELDLIINTGVAGVFDVNKIMAQVQAGLDSKLTQLDLGSLIPKNGQ